MMHKCYVRHPSADDVAVALRDAGARGLLVAAPLPDSAWVAVVAVGDVPLDDHEATLASLFGAALLVSADDSGWALRVTGVADLAIDARHVTKDDARKAAQSVSRALDAPRITTALERVLRRPLQGAAALERLGDALALVGCGRSFGELAADTHVACLRVEGARITGRVAEGAAGAGYAHVGDLVEDTVVDLLERGRFEAALMQLRGYDIHLSVEEGTLRCKAPQGIITTGLREALGRHRSAIIEHLP